MLILLACSATVPGTPDVGTDSDPVVASDAPTFTFVELDEGEGADLAVRSNGVLYASFVRGGHVWVRVSQDGGATWGDAAWVNDAGSPSVYGVSHPEIDVDDDRVLVSMPSGHNQALWVSDRDARTFEAVTWVGHDQHDWQFEAIFFQGRLAPDGSIWSSFHAFPHGSWDDGWKGVARESNDFELEDVSGAAPGLPCECCAHDLFFTSGADVLLAWRGNVDDVRDMWVASGHGGFDQVVEAGDLGPEISYCPVEGPRLAEAPDGTVWMTWADAMGEPYAPYVATSADGVTWSASEKVLPELDSVRPSPTLGIDGAGRVLLSWTSEFEPTGFAFQDGSDWVQLEPDRELRHVEVVGQGDFLGGVGADEAGRVWFFEVD